LLTTTTVGVTTSLAETTTTLDDSGGVTVYVTESGTKYHQAGCRYLSKSKIAISLQEAKAQGHEPCSVCKPPT
jgi:micrococcal nuclease